MLDNLLGGKAAFRCFRGGLDVVNAVPAYFCQSIETCGEASAPADDARQGLGRGRVDLRVSPYSPVGRIFSHQRPMLLGQKR